MENVWTLVHYLREHPAAAVGAVVALVGVRFLLNRKPKLVREADKRLDQLRKERSGHYDKVRPPR